ncbi:futalosine hydrolase [Streptomyces sp. H27-D2]|uniref:futalosine hydrolase n=1 Tax=Streptomyces sp. H27-D2 TaxID=3046304 RepID=UPI002DBCB991|nr:futalosine hydrolase [Streptomyces sp. H27-D2]MEC4020865.1 futalosine hydrolase [Streptomyces sp. H27-D2]
MRVLIVTAVPAERDAVALAVRTAAVRTTAVRTEAGADSGAEPAAEPVEVALPGYVLHRHVPHRFNHVFDGLDHRDDLVFDLLAAGVGPAAAAAGTATALTAAALAQQPYDLVISAGIGGGFTHTRPPAPTPADPAPVGSVVVADIIAAADLGAETPDGFLAVTELGFGTDAHRPPEALARAVAEAAGAAYGTVLTVSTVTGTAERAALLADRHPRALAEAMEGFGVAEAAAAQGLPVLEIRAISNRVGPRDRGAWRIREALDALGAAFSTLPAVLAGDSGSSTAVTTTTTTTSNRPNSTSTTSNTPLARRTP